MHPVEGANWIAGGLARSRGGGRADVHEALAPRAVLGAWPCSGFEDLEHALGSLALEPARSSAMEPRMLDEAARLLTLDVGGRTLVARRLGLGPAVLESHWRSPERDRSRRHPAWEGRGKGRRMGGVALLAPDWSDLLERPFSDCATELCLGRSILLVSDPRVPMLADSLVQSLIDAGLATDRIAVLHGLTREALGQALLEGRITSVRASGGRERISFLRKHATGMAECQLRLLRSVAMRVGRQEDPEEAALRVLDRAFGVERTLFGQRDDQVGRVFCDAHLFSRFTAELLKELDRAEAHFARPLIDRSAAQELRRQGSEGLDEGATLVAGGAQVRGASETVVPPTVFTNLEAHMTCWSRQAPMPILGLVRG